MLLFGKYSVTVREVCDLNYENDMKTIKEILHFNRCP